MKIENRVVEKIGVISVMNDADVIQLEFEIDNQLTPLLKLSDCDKVYINYQNGLTKDRYLVQNIIIDGGKAKLFWLLGKNATKKAGKTYFVVCAQKTENGVIKQEWNTILTSFDVEKGLEVLTESTKEYEDIFSQLFDAIDEKQNKLIAGTGISIDGNVISSTGQIDAYTKEETNALLAEKQNKGDYATVTELQDEAIARAAADNELQNQIDAITVSSDVIDVVGTYADLQNYDTSHVKANDIIKVMQDSTHSNAISYYRWVISEDVGSWVYVGSEGPYYTKSETDSLLTAYLPIFQGVSQFKKVLAVNNDGNAVPTELETLTGRKQLDLLSYTENSPYKIEEIITDYGTGIYDIVESGYVAGNTYSNVPANRNKKIQIEKGGVLIVGSDFTTIVGCDGYIRNVDNDADFFTNWSAGTEVATYLELQTALLDYLSKTEAQSTYQPKNRYFTNTTVALADWEEELTPTYVDYPYKATITIQGVTPNTWAYIVWGQQIDEVYPDCNTVQGGVEIFASEPIALTIPTIKIEG